MRSEACVLARRYRTLLTALLAFLIVALLCAPGTARSQEVSQKFTFEAPKVALADIPFTQEIRAGGAVEEPLTLRVAGESYIIEPGDFEQAESGMGLVAEVEDVVVPSTGEFTMSLVQGREVISEKSSEAIWGWLSVLPPVLAIGMALITRQVIPALMLGIWVGAWMTYGVSVTGLWYGLLDTLQVYVIQAIAPPSGDTGHASIIVFTLMMGGLIGIIYRNGGAYGIADRVSRLASTPRRGQLSTSGLGFGIFFSTYANALVIGNTMRPVTDRLRISREKLAFIVDSTAAPLEAVAIVSTWIGFMVGLIAASVGTTGLEQGAYAIYLQSIPYSFYPLLMLFFVLLVGASGRDFGPMYKAERRARIEGEVLRPGAQGASGAGSELETKDEAPQRAFNALVPIGVLVGTVIVGLYITGDGDNLAEIIGNAATGKVLVWSGLLGVLVAAVLSIGQRILTLSETMDAWYDGFKSVLFVLIILVLAWSLAAVAEVVNTANYLVSVLGDWLMPQIIPALLFVIAAGVSFATGTSFGTMGILMPLAMPLTWTVMQNDGMASPEYYYIMYATVATVLAGSVWGDHCSPISDTTIISSVGSQCDHIDHVRTQLPYALTVGAVALLLGLLPVGFGFPWWLSLPIGAVVLVAVLFLFGKRADEGKGIEGEREPEQRQEPSAGGSSR